MFKLKEAAKLLSSISHWSVGKFVETDRGTGERRCHRRE